MLYKQIAMRSCFSIFCVLALAKSSICQTPPSAEKIEAAMKMMDQIAAERFEQKARAPLARESRPKDRTQPASLESRLKQIDSQSACLKWFQEIQVISNIEDFSYKGIERDRLVKMLKASESEVMELDAIFRERVEKHIKARQPFEASISVDRQRQTSIASEPVLTPDELLSKRSILEYARQERLSEFHALDRIVDVIDPRQFEVLVGHWGKRMMSIPISQKYLGLSPEQCEAVAKDEEAFERTKREIIMNAEFRHFNPWRLVMKMDSVTTPVRMVVDPSMTRMNEILAKGENRIGQIFNIMIRCRCTRRSRGSCRGAGPGRSGTWSRGRRGRPSSGRAPCPLGVPKSTDGSRGANAPGS